MRKLISLLSLLIILLVSSSELFAQPPSQARYVSFRNRTASSVDIRWVNGDGGNRIVVMSESAITNTPVDYDTYPANAAYGTSGTEFIGSEYVVYNGTGRRVSVTALDANTTYYVHVFEYHSGTEYNLGTATANPRSFTTLFNTPQPPTAIALVDRGVDYFEMSWSDPTSGDWDGFELDVSGVSDFSTHTSPYDDYEMADVGSANGWYIDNMAPATAHYFRIRSFYGMLTSTWAVFGSNPVWTLDTEPGDDGSCGTVSAYDQTTMTMDFTAPTGGAGGYLVYMDDADLSSGPTAIADFDDFDGAGVGGANSDWSANSSGSPAAFAGSVALVQNDPATSVSVTGLTAGTDYYFGVDPYNNSGGDVTSNYVQDGFYCGPYPTISEDLADVTGFEFTFYGQSSLSFSWNPTTGAEYYIVVVKPLDDFDGTDNHPVDGTTYPFTVAETADCSGSRIHSYTNTAAWSDGDMGGTATSTARAFRVDDPNTCLGSGKEFVHLNDLNSNTRYYFRVYAVNQDASPGSENYSNPATGDRWTLFDTDENGYNVSYVDAEIDDCATGDVLVSWGSGSVNPDPDQTYGTDEVRYLVIGRPTWAPRADAHYLLVDGFDYSALANADWSLAHELAIYGGAANRRILYDGTDESFVATGLTPNMMFSFDVYVYASNYTSSFCTVCGSHNYTALSFGTGSERILIPEVVPDAPSGTIDITVTADSPNTLDLSWDAVAGADGYFLLATAGATAPSEEPECTWVYDYENLNQFSTSGCTMDGSNEDILGYYTGTSTTITNLVANTVYSFSLYTFNGDDYDASFEWDCDGDGHNTNYSDTYITGTRTTLAPNPSCSSSVALINPTDGSLDIDLTACGGTDNFMVLMHTSIVTDQPVDGTSTYPNVNIADGGSVNYNSYGFPSGTSYVVYNNVAASKTITVTGLAPETEYFVELFDYNGAIASGAENFNVPGVTDSEWTLSTEPTEQAEFLANNSLTFTNVQSNQLDVNWNPAIGGPYYMLLATQGDVPVPSQHPVDATGYTADTDYIGHTGSSLTLDGTPWYVMYVGTGSSVGITNMNAETEYSFMVYSANWDGANTPTWNYLTSPDPDWAKRYTLSPEPTAPPTSLTVSARSTNSMTLHLSSPSGANPEYVVIYGYEGGPVSATPVDGEAQPVGSYNDWTDVSGDPEAIGVGGGNKIVRVFATPSGINATWTINGLTPDTHYYWEAWGFNQLPGETSTANYNMTSVTDDNWTYATEPTAMLSTEITLVNGSLIADWSAYAGPADKFLVVMTEGNTGPGPEGTDPTDGNAYAAGNSDWSSAPAYTPSSIGSRVVYNGTGTSVTVTNVPFARYMHVSIWPYNGSNALSYNYATPAGTKSVWSWDDDPDDAGAFTVTPQTGGTVLQISDFASAGTTDVYVLIVSDVATPTATLPAKGMNLVDDGSNDIPLNTLWTYTSATHTLNGHKVLYHGDGSTAISFPMNVSGLYPDCSEYFFTVYTYRNGTLSGASGAPRDEVNNFTSNPVSASGTNYAASPSSPATAVAFANASTDETATVRQYDVSWTASTTGDNYLVIAKEGASASSWNPADGTTYAANVNYGSGYNTADGYVVYNGTGTSFTFVAENSNKYAVEYSFKVYTYNTCGSTPSINYWMGSPATGTDHILALLPTDSPSALTPAVGVFTDTDDESSLNLSWSGGGNKYIVLAELDSDPSTNPVNGTTYVGNSDFDAAPSLGTSKVVYTGTSTNISVSGLDPHGEYHFSVYSFNDKNVGATTVYGSENFKVPGIINTRHAITRDPLIWIDTDVATATEIQETQATITWDAATVNDGPIAGTTVDGYIVVVRDGSSAPTGSPADGSTYTAGSVNMYTNALGDGYRCYVGTGTSFTLTGLNTLSDYTVRVYSYADAGIDEATNYSEGMTITAGNQEYEEVTFSTLAPDPTAAPTNLTFGARTETDMVVNWDMGGTGSSEAIVLYKTTAFTPTNDEPVQGVGYTAGATIGGATVGFSGAAAGAATTTLTGLTADQTYYVRVYGYNESGGIGQNYYPLVGTAYAEGSHTSLDNEPTAAPSALNITGNDGSGTVDLGWTPGSNTLLYVTTGGAPSAPVDGTTYTSGYAYNGAASSLAGFTAVAGSTYTMYAYSYNGTNYAGAFNSAGAIVNQGSENYYGTPGTLTFTALDSEPTAPASVVFGTRTTSTMQVSWTGSADMFLVLRNTSAITGTPTDGSIFTAGGTIGGDDIVYVGSSASFTDNTLSTDTPYFYSVFAYNTAGSGSENYNGTSADGDHTTLDTEPSAASGVSTDATSEYTLDISWSNNGAAYVLVYANAGSAVTATPVDGITYSGASAAYAGANQLVYQGAGTSFQMTGLNDGTDYYYAIYTYNGDNYVGSEGAENYAGSLTHMASTDVAGGVATQLVVTSSPVNAVSGTSFNVTVEMQDATNAPTTYASNVVIVIRDQASNSVGSGTITAGNTDVVISCTYTNANGEANVEFDTDNNASLTEDNFFVDIIADAPSTSPSSLVLTATSGTTIRVQWTLGGDNDGTAVYCRYNQANNVTPTDGQSAPTPNLSYTSSPASQIVYAGTGNDITVTGLSTRTVYYMKLYGYTGVYADGTENFNTSSPVESSIRTRRSKVATPGGEMNDFDFEVTGVQPNPAADHISFSINSYVGMSYSVAIYTIGGELVANIVNGEMILGNRDFNNVSLDNLASGTYMLQISTETQAAVQQFVIVK